MESALIIGNLTRPPENIIFDCLSQIK